ncbi:hypothetical protein ARMGADRAFT_827607 [Armillaria gallica]|uniref:Uncharacterized protein n=1 Tax=Armillaria gallica TaxID=47427 RepID=A0A2H3CC42_ARMGA|nr:hypothetical protein ARMGADRAFT_827607 [Armillaria gallica]
MMLEACWLYMVMWASQVSLYRCCLKTSPPMYYARSGFYHGLILLAARAMSLVPFVQDPLMLPRIHSCTPSCINPYLVHTSILKAKVLWPQSFPQLDVEMDKPWAIPYEHNFRIFSLTGDLMHSKCLPSCFPFKPDS